MPEKKFKIMKSVSSIAVALIAGLLLGGTANADSSANNDNELFDTYFFLSNSDSVTCGAAQATVTAIAGSVVEIRTDCYRVDRGVVTFRAKQVPLNVVAATSTVRIPARSVATITTDGASFSVSANTTGTNEPITVVDQSGQGERLTQGATYPATNQLNGAISNSTQKPLLVIGRDISCELTERDQTLSLPQGRMFFYTPREIKIETPMGLVTAKAQSQFYLASSPGFLRIMSCRGPAIVYNYKSKFRKVGIAEDFAVFDHRPMELEVVPPDGIGRKDVGLIDLDGQQLTAAKSIFSVVTLLKSPSYLGDWKRRSSLDRNLEGGMLKSAAAFAAGHPTADSFYKAPSFPRGFSDTNIR